jgi:hypothetical protein
MAKLVNTGKDDVKWYYQSIAGELETALAEYARYRERNA